MLGPFFLSLPPVQPSRIEQNVLGCIIMRCKMVDLFQEVLGERGIQYLID